MAGTYIGSTGTTANTIGSNSTFIGINTSPLTDGDDNEVVIAGGSTYRTVGLGSNSTLIGNSSTTKSQIMGALTLPNTTASTSSTTGALIVSGGVGIAKELNVGSTTASTSSSTGALIVVGGVGIAKELNVGSTTASTSSSTGALIVAGGAGIAGAVNIGSNTASTSTTTGALEVVGGVGIGGAVYIGSTISIAGGTPGLGKVLTSDANGLATWSNNGGGGVLSKTDSYDIATTDNANVLIFSGSAASKTIKLPSAVTVGAGREITIKNIASVSVTVGSAGGYVISDSSTTTASTLAIGIEPSNNWIKAISDGTNWIILRALF
jgi:hypothetical protein